MTYGVGMLIGSLLSGGVLDYFSTTAVDGAVVRNWTAFWLSSAAMSFVIMLLVFSRVRRYLVAPRLLAPYFWLGAPLRAYPELKASIPDMRSRLRFAVRQGLRVVTAPASSGRMARRLQWLQQAQFGHDQPMDLPALVVTGEPSLERVVPPRLTAEYLNWLPKARAVTMPGTGHGGTITQAHEFAALVADFAAGLPQAGPVARRA